MKLLKIEMCFYTIYQPENERYKCGVEDDDKRGR